MDGGLQNTIVILASLMVAVFAAQTILLLIFVIAFRQWLNRTGSVVEQISRNLEPVLATSRELMVESRERLNALGANLHEISQLAKNQMVRVDDFVKDTTERAQMQIVRLDQLVGDTMDRVEETTEAIQHGVLKPVRELTAVVAGIRTGVEFLMKRNRKTVERATQDEEMFI